MNESWAMTVICIDNNKSVYSFIVLNLSFIVLLVCGRDVHLFNGSSLFGGCCGPEKGRLVCVCQAYL